MNEPHLAGASDGEKMVGMNRPSKAARERWARIIREQRESGQTVAAFCAQRGIGVSSFYPWKRRLAGVGHEGAGPEGVFVEARRGADDRGGGVTVVLGGGRRIIVGPGFDRALLREVIDALESDGDGPAGGGRA